jgi:hypothetical protein
MANVNSTTIAGGSPASMAISIHFGPRAKRENVSSYSRGVLTSIMKAAGVHTVWITSTYRDAHDQARAMAHNIEKTGAPKQRALYKGKPGSPLVDLYEREKAAVAEAERRGIDTGVRDGFLLQRHLITVLERGISDVGPEKVSNHSGLQAILNVFDVDPATLKPKGCLDAFLKAARSESRVTRIIPPPKDPAFHFEIAQPGSFEVSPLTRATA